MAKDIEPKLKLISEYLKINSNEFFVIPTYQRAYSWDIVQCDKLWQDVESFIDSQVTDPYFFGTIIVDCSETNRFSLVDGQQRTTTFILLLKALLLRLQEVLGKFKRDEDSEALEEGLKEKRNKILDILYKIDVDERIGLLKNWNSVKKHVFLENESNNELYPDELQKIIESEDYEVAEQNCHKIPRKQKDNKYTNFFRNFKFFYEKLGEYQETQIKKFATTFLEKCQIIEIRSWQLEQAINMFNSLNSTGMPLSTADIISAELHSKADDKTKFNETWKTIIQHVADLDSKKIVNIDSILQQYMYIKRAKSKEYIKNGRTDVTTPGLKNYYTIINKDLLKKPMDLCASFGKIAEIWDLIKDYATVKLLLKFNENAKIYLISYLDRYEKDDISEDIVVEITECLLRLFTILELVETGFSSNNFKTFLFGENVKFVDNNYSISKIKDDFDQHIKKNWHEENLKQAILEYEKNALVFLNEYLYSKKKGHKFNFSENVNVEHIMPESGKNIDIIRQDAGIKTKEEFDSIVNMLGNKILLEENINKSIGNEWFKTKKQKSIKDKSGYKDSHYAIALDLVNFASDVWLKDDIEKATNKAADRIVKFIFGK